LISGVLGSLPDCVTQAGIPTFGTRPRYCGAFFVYINVAFIYTMQHRIETIGEKKLIGKRMMMTFVDNKTADLWRSFMPVRNQVPNVIGAYLYSVQVYPHGFFEGYNPTTEFEKCAAIEVSGFDNVPSDMETFTIPAGLYAVFHYKGDPRQAAPFFQQIFSEWLPNSGYVLDNRPHFEILGEKYKNNDLESEEEVYIPVRLK
jgi:AraC family transcriptional regulator